jgi:hypothetical protein
MPGLLVRVVAAAATRTLKSSMPSYLHGDAFREELKSERDRRASLEQRGVAVISLSGVLSALLLNTSKDIGRSPWTAALLVAALVALVVAALLGLLCTMPRRYGGVTDAYLKEILEEFWDEGDEIASRRVGGAHLGMIIVSRRINRVKANLLQAAIVASATGVALLSTSVVGLVISRNR